MLGVTSVAGVVVVVCVRMGDGRKSPTCCQSLIRSIVNCGQLIDQNHVVRLTRFIIVLIGDILGLNRVDHNYMRIGWSVYIVSWTVFYLDW